MIRNQMIATAGPFPKVRPRMTYIARLHAAMLKKGTPALVGLDPRWDQLPPEIQERARRDYDDPIVQVAAAFEEFCVRLIDVVAPLVPIVKPQAAFFEEWGPDGCLALARVMRYARAQGLLVICDAKRGDIGTTAEAYARAYLAGDDPQRTPWAADALTINPYLGVDTLEPFAKVARERHAGLYVLVRTSNPGASAFQDLAAPVARSAADQPAQPIYAHVADAVEQLAAAEAVDEGFSSVGAVVGATYPQELAMLRERMPHVPLLVPGYGSQGGTSADVAAAFRPNGLGAVINSSRAINFAYRQAPWKEQFRPDQWEAAAEAATRHMIADLATATPAGAIAAQQAGDQ